MRSLTQFLGHISGVPRREAILRVPMMMRGRGVRMARVSAAIFLWTLAISCVSLVHGATDPSDVSSLNTMFTGLNNDPKLTNWVQSAGDPCSNNWLGITSNYQTWD